MHRMGRNCSTGTSRAAQPGDGIALAMSGKMRHTRLADESEEYLSRREELQSLEVESMKLRERVAEARRELPQGPAVKDYLFLEGPADLNGGDSPTRTVHLSELFTGSDRSLVIYHFMYGKRQTSPCPMC